MALQKLLWNTFQFCFWQLPVEPYFANLHSLHCIKEPGLDSTFFHWKHDFLGTINASYVWDTRVYLFLQNTSICYIIYIILAGMAWFKNSIDGYFSLAGLLFLGSCVFTGFGEWFPDWVITVLHSPNSSFTKLSSWGLGVGGEIAWLVCFVCGHWLCKICNCLALLWASFWFLANILSSFQDLRQFLSLFLAEGDSIFLKWTAWVEWVSQTRWEENPSALLGTYMSYLYFKRFIKVNVLHITWK